MEKNYEELIRKADECFNNKQFSESFKLYSEIAEETGDVYCAICTINVSVLLAEADIAMSNLVGVQAFEHALSNAEIGFKWAQACKKEEFIMAKHGELVDRQFSKLLMIGGKSLFMLQNDACVNLLISASDLNNNEANLLLGMWFDSVVSNALKSNVDDTSFYQRNGAQAVNYFEKYIKDYNPDEAESDELETAHTLVSYYYEVGMGVPKSPELANKHKQLGLK